MKILKHGDIASQLKKQKIFDQICLIKKKKTGLKYEQLIGSV